MKIVSIFLFLILPVFSFAQSNSNATTLQADDRLVEAFGSEYINKLKNENPFLIKRWNFYLDHAYIITDEVTGKEANYKTIQIEDLANINILKVEKEQKLERAWDVPTIYKIEHTNKLLIFYSGKDFNKKLKEHLNQ